jgi:multidrug efflux system outer membrane protein
MRSLPLLLALGLAGCAHIPPDAHPIAARDAQAAQLAPGIALGRSAWPERHWWTQFGDTELDALISDALASAPSLDVAATRIGAARAVLAMDGADSGPSAGLVAHQDRQRYSGNGLFPAPIGGNFFSDSAVQLRAGVDFDWWGKHKAQIRAALGEVKAREADYAQAEQSLAVAIAATFFRIQGLWAHLALNQQRIAVQEALLGDCSVRVAAGLASIAERHSAEAALAGLRRQSDLLGLQGASEREALRALLGADGNALATLRAVPLPKGEPVLPATLGLELLARRPDLQAARWRIEAALGKVDAERAAFYPQLNLSGAIGLDSLSLGKLLQVGSRTVLGGVDVAVPLFDAKRLVARFDGARAKRDELIADYNQTVFNAVRDVAQQGVTLAGIERESQQQAEVLTATRALVAAVQARMAQGLAARQSLLAVQDELLKQQDGALELQQQSLLAQLALTKALGGGYRAALQPTQKDNHE